MTYKLLSDQQGLSLIFSDHPDWRPFQIDFTQGALYYRYQQLHGKNELIAKAIGWKKNIPLHVFDVTAGLGREAFLLAALGCQVTLFERHPTIAALLRDGLQRAQAQTELAPIIARMHFIEGCAVSYLQSLTGPLPDVIYCDPMFPERSKSAAVKKDMQILQTVVGEDQDATTLIHLALQKTHKRVVVKRPQFAPSLKDKPDFSYEGRSHRYDVYVIVR